MMNPHPQVVDLRSDTVTRPTPRMLQVLSETMVGDDVLGDDPTVAQLERETAELTGHEAAVFVPSGTMGNQCAIAAHTQPGDVMIVEEEAHILYYEVGAPAVFNGVMTRTLPSRNGVLDSADIRRAYMKRSLHTPGSVLLALENTHNRAGGAIVPPSALNEYRRLADELELKLHLDGARVFNAAVALGCSVRDLTSMFDSASVCLSKGLGAPVGSVLTGSAEFIERARVWRKRLGGGMRQAGLLAACGLVAIRERIDRLAEDHRRAHDFATRIVGRPGWQVDPASVQTNMVLVTVEGESAFWLDRLREYDVWALPPAPDRIRFVFHSDIDDEKLDRAVQAIWSV